MFNITDFFFITDFKYKYKKHNTICVGHNHTQDTRPTNKTKSQTQYVLDTLHKTNKTKNTTQYVLDTTQYTQDITTQTKHVLNITTQYVLDTLHICTQDTIPRQTKQKTQHNMCWTHHTQYTRPRQTKQKHNTICVRHTTRYNMC